MITNKPEVIAWEVCILSDSKSLGTSPSYPEWAEVDENLVITPLVRLSDYEALQIDRDQQYEMKVKARQQRDEVVSTLIDLTEAAKELAEWCYQEAGADPSLTPGLEKIMDLLGISDV